MKIYFKGNGLDSMCDKQQVLYDIRFGGATRESATKAFDPNRVGY
jgi:hypothetical protein